MPLVGRGVMSKWINFTVRRQSFVRPRVARRWNEQDAAFRAQRRAGRLRQELAIRAAVSLLIFAFNETVGIGTTARANPLVRIAALLGLGLNGPYYLATRTSRRPHLQAYVRMLADIALLTLGLYGAGGLAAAPHVGVYAITVVYVGVSFSGLASLVATGVATASYLALAVLQDAGWLPGLTSAMAGDWSRAAFNLLILNIVGGLTSVLTERYRQNRKRLSVLYQDLERAHDELGRLNAEIRQAARFQVLSGVVAGVSHEIRNVLQLALGHLQLMRRPVETGAPEALPHLAEVRHSFDTAVRIIETTLDVARRPSGEKGPVSIPEVARRIADLKRYDLRRDGIAIRVSFPPDFPFVLGERFQIEQILLNLVLNAQDALRGAAEPRAIDIVGLIEFERAVVEVRDTGPGIAPAVLPRLFEPFYTTKALGTGLGLAISAGIVRDLGGELNAGNRPEAGAVFRVSLPAVHPRGCGGRPPPPAAGQRPPSRSTGAAGRTL